MELFADNPITSVAHDAFGRAEYITIFRDVILQTGPLPFCVGIYGEWGSGKSSFMHMLETSFNGNAAPPGVKTIWFNPWKYDTKEDLWHALLQSVVSEIQEKNKSKIIQDAAINLSESLAWLSLRKFITALTAGLITESDQQGIITAFAAQDMIYHQHINTFEKDFKILVQEYVRNERTSEDGRLIIFIDDLDRCLPENAITVLESLKLFFDNTQCIFVLGMDHYIVEAGIKHRYDGKLDMRGRDYLDKIIQIPFYLPPVSFNDIEKALRSETNRLFMTSDIWKIIEFGMGSNPRKTRRFINCFSLSQKFLKRDTQPNNTPREKLHLETQDNQLAQLLIFQMVFPDFYHHLRYASGDWSFLVTDILPKSSREISEEKLFKDKEALELVWNNQDLQRFLRYVSSPDIVPNAQTVRNLLQITSLIVPSPIH